MQWGNRFSTDEEDEKDKKKEEEEKQTGGDAKLILRSNFIGVVSVVRNHKCQTKGRK